jgi:hypothetical protein
MKHFDTLCDTAVLVIWFVRLLKTLEFLILPPFADLLEMLLCFLSTLQWRKESPEPWCNTVNFSIFFRMRKTPILKHTHTHTHTQTCTQNMCSECHSLDHTRSSRPPWCEPTGRVASVACGSQCLSGSGTKRVN